MTTQSEQQSVALTSAEDYFIHVVKPNQVAFFGEPSSFASALNLATTLFHFHEWVFDQYKSQLESHLGMTFADKNKFWQEVQKTNPNFGYIRDVANASKHVKIGEAGHKTSTGMRHISNTHIITTGWGAGGFGQGRYGGGPNVVFDDGDKKISFDDCAKDLFSYWKSLLEQLTGRTNL